MNLSQIWEQTKTARPTIHAITNYVTVNDCANIIHAAYGAPIMAQDAREVEEIQRRSHALVLNLGTVPSQEAVLRAAKTANAMAHPIVLDPVGVGASTLREACTREVLRSVSCAVIRGNASEIYTLSRGGAAMCGVEANAADKVTERTLEVTLEALCEYSRETGAVIAQTGAIDLICCGSRAAIVRGGSAWMERITGAGCMLTALIATLCGANPTSPMEATTAAIAAMAVCGEQAEEKIIQMREGTGSFRTRLIDAVSCLTGKQLAQHARVEYRTVGK